MFVPDGTNQTVRIVDRRALEVVGAFGGAGRWVGQFYGAHVLAVDSQGALYIGETYEGKRVQKFTDTGTPVTSWGTIGTGDGEFSGPRGIAVDDSGFIYVAGGTGVVAEIDALARSHNARCFTDPFLPSNAAPGMFDGLVRTIRQNSWSSI